MPTQVAMRQSMPLSSTAGTRAMRCPRSLTTGPWNNAIFRGGGTTSGTQETYGLGHAAEVTWILPDEGPEESLPPACAS
jgi:hypothetical protein